MRVNFLVVKPFSLLLLMTLLQACGLNRIEVHTEFSPDTEVETGLQVFHQEEAVGEVVDVVRTPEKVLVSLAIKKAAAQSIDADSAVLVNRLRAGAPLEIISRTISEKNGPAEKNGLQDGQKLKGLDSIFQVGAWMLGDLSNIESGSISDYVDALNGYLQSEQFDRDTALMKREFAVLRQSAEQALVEIENELNQAIDDIETSERSINKAVDALSEELAPTMEEMAAIGANLAIEIESFVESMQSMNQEEKQSAKELLDRLEKALERINRRIKEVAEGASRKP